MLSDKDFIKIEKSATSLYNALVLDILEEIAIRVAKVGYANTVVHNDMKILEEMGILYEDVVTIVSAYNETTYDEINRIFQEAGITTIGRDDVVYRLMGKEPLPLSYSMKQILASTAVNTHNNLKNLTNTIAKTTQIQFLNAVNMAYLETTTGVKSYTQAIIDALNRINDVYVEYPSGARRSVETAVRSNILTATNQMSGRLQMLRAEQMECDLMELSAHSEARPTHAEWQGKIVSLSGTDPRYLTLEDIGYGTITGFQGINCRHTWFPYYEGSTPVYTNKELEQLKNETVTYNGRTMTKYEASQVQRGLERKIRYDKREIAKYQGLLKSGILKGATTQEIVEIKSNFSKRTLIYNTDKKKLVEFVNSTNRKGDLFREYLVDPNYTNNTISQMRKVTKIANAYNTTVVGQKVNGVTITEVGEHIISRTYARKINFDDVVETLQNPVKFGKIRADNSQQIKGSNCTVVINVKTGKLITVFPKKTKGGAK